MVLGPIIHKMRSNAESIDFGFGVELVACRPQHSLIKVRVRPLGHVAISVEDAKLNFAVSVVSPRMDPENTY